MKRSRLSVILLLPFALLLMGARGVALVDPAPIAVPAGLNAKAVSKAIRTGITLRGWTVTKDENGRIDAVLDLRKHSATIAIVYDDKTVRPMYVSSTNLLYEEKNGERFIHRNYTRWMQNVITDVTRTLQAAAIQSE